MAAGTVLSGGFPGRVAQEVHPNPKCNGCLHFDGQAGRTGACTIGLKPFLCGEGDAADIGYAPISRGAGSYLTAMQAHVPRAPEGGDQEVSSLHGAGSTRAVQFKVVTLGEEHAHLVKSMLIEHTRLQKSMCRLCQSSGMIGMMPANTGPQVCTCSPIEARTVAKSLMTKLSNRERSVIGLDDLIAFVYDVAKSGGQMEKATFYHPHGKYEVTPAGGGKHNVDFHPRGGGEKTHVATANSPKAAYHEHRQHALKFAQGSTPQQKEAAAVEIAPGWHAQAGDEAREKKKTGVGSPGGHDPKRRDIGKEHTERVSISEAHTNRMERRTSHSADSEAHTTRMPKKAEKSETDNDVEKAGDGPRHPPNLKPGDLITHSSASGFGKQTSPEMLGHDPHGQLAEVHRVSKNPHTGETHVHVRYHNSSGKMSKPHLLSGYDRSRHATHEDMQHHSKTLKTHFNAKAKLANAPAPSPSAKKSLDALLEELHNEDDIEKSLKFKDSPEHGSGATHAEADHGHYVSKPKNHGYQVTYSPHEGGDELVGYWHATADGAHEAANEHHHKITHGGDEFEESHDGNRVWRKQTKKSLKFKDDGYATAKHGTYLIHNDADDEGTHHVLYSKKGSGEMPTMTKHGSRREALGAIVEHHLNQEKDSTKKSYLMPDGDDIEKSLRWSHKTPGQAKTSHGTYHIHQNDDGSHTATYIHKESGKVTQHHFRGENSHRHALGAVTEHHLKVRPPPKKRDPNAPKKKPKALKHGEGGCPPCP